MADLPPQPPSPHSRALRRPAASGDVVSRPPALRDDIDDDGPSSDDIERFGDITRPCPSCGKEIADDSLRCYHCGHYVTEGPGVRRFTTAQLIMVTLAILILIAGVIRIFI